VTTRKFPDDLDIVIVSPLADLFPLDGDRGFLFVLG
jgi:hypothetical protein